jgi:N-glycosylase/DNA lyase
MNAKPFTKNIEDFSLRNIALSGQCFRLEENEPGIFSLFAGSRALCLRQEGSLISFGCTEREFEKIWRPYFDLDTDYGNIRGSIDPEDEYLLRAAGQAAGLRILRQDPFETIITFIISQQNNIPRIRKCVRLLCEKYGKKKERKGIGAYAAFPEAAVLAEAEEEDLLGCNLGYRARYVQEASRQIAEKEISLRKLEGVGDAEAETELKKLSGVGTKVADCVMLFALHRTGAFPIDTHIRQILEEHYQDGFPLERYGSCAGILQQYMFFGEVNRK